jgi:hypothetical protein
VSPGQQPTTTHPIGAYQKILVADLDGDGFPDLIPYGGGINGPVYLIRNHGSLGYGSEELLLPAPLPPITKIIAADVDLDGDLDLLVLFGDSSGASASPNLLLINDGSGHFTDQTAQRWPTGFYSTMDAVVVDVNHDGWPDIVECNIYPHHHLFLGQPNGVFIDATNNLPGNSPYGWQIAAGDIDGDGSPDLVIVGGLPSAAGGRDWLWLNDGQGHFRDESWRIPTRINDYAVAVGDIDGDGHADLVLGVQVTGGQPAAVLHSQVLRNNGSGVFTVDPSALPPQGPYDWHADARLVDVDGDGYLDLVIEARITYSGSLFFNDGTGHFTPGWSRLPAVPSCFGMPMVVPADMDADGDLDLVTIPVACPQRIYVFHSLRRHLTAAASPRVGQPFQIDLNGQPNGLGVLGIALGHQFLRLPPVGTLQLDLTHYALVGPTGLDSAGHAAVTLPVPQLPALSGVPLYLQGLVTSAPWNLMTFTNALGQTIGP